MYSIVDEINSGVPFRNGDSDPGALVSVFKLLLDSTGRSLFDEQLFLEIVKQCKSSGTNELTHSFCVRILRESISKLPDCSLYTIKYIVDFFTLVSNKSKTNNMTTQKIAEIFSPIFCRPSTIGENIMYDIIPPCVECINVLITNKNSVFSDLLPKREDDITGCPDADEENEGSSPE